MEISGVAQVMSCDVVSEVQRTVKHMLKSGQLAIRFSKLNINFN